MNLSVRISYLFLLVLVLFFLIWCNGESTESEIGTISILIVDNDSTETPISGVEITLVPGNIMKTTNENGICIFQVYPGDYYLEADVCCIGPGFIHYHEPVPVLKNEIKEVKLRGCLRCL